MQVRKQNRRNKNKKAAGAFLLLLIGMMICKISMITAQGRRQFHRQRHSPHKFRYKPVHRKCSILLHKALRNVEAVNGVLPMQEG